MALPNVTPEQRAKALEKAASVPKGFGSTAIQAVVHQEPKPFRVSTRFGGTVIQVVVHQRRGRGRRRACFGGTVNQAVVHR